MLDKFAVGVRSRRVPGQRPLRLRSGIGAAARAILNRMSHLRIAVAGAFLALLAGPAQTAAAPPQGQSGWIETVTVIAHPAAPALWHAREGNGDVAILAIVQPLPDDLKWNTTPLDGLLVGARVLLLPPQLEVGLFQRLWFFLTERELLHPPEGKTLWDILDPQIAARFASVCDLLPEPKDRYADNSPVIAGLRVGSDFRHIDYLTTHEPEDTIRALARAHGVQARRVASYDVLSGGEEVLNLAPAATGRCLDAAASDVVFQSRHAAPAAEAWAAGDVAGMEANWSQPQFYDCLIALSSHATRLNSRAVDDTVAAIAEALDGGGHSVAVVDIGILLRKNGVLEKLAAKGISIAGPAG